LNSASSTEFKAQTVGYQIFGLFLQPVYSNMQLGMEHCFSPTISDRRPAKPKVKVYAASVQYP
jgi:hypothetical protein